MPGYIPEPKEDSFDLVNAIYHLKSSSPIQWTAVHVKGHQDKLTSQLTFLEKLNVRMDKLAKTYWLHLSQKNSTWVADNSISIYGEGWQLWNRGSKVRDTKRPTLYAIIQNPITINYWVRHGRIPSEATHLIDWTASGQALSKMKLGKRRRVCKHASGDCGVGTTLVKWNLQDDDQCPRCGQPEDTVHVLRCPEASDTWEAALATLHTKLARLDTDPDIQEAIASAISSWYHNEPPPEPPPAPDPHQEQNALLSTAIQEQSLIGWLPFLEGLISSQWKQAQATHLSSIGSSRSCYQWVQALIRQLHQLTDTMWQHRNDIKHTTSQPRQKRMREMLDDEIIQVMMLGPGDLPRADALRLFQRNIISLLLKPTLYKQHWLYQVATAQQRQKRIREHDDELNTISLSQSRLFKWAKTGVTT
jgi:hypothetical protein